MSQLYKIMDTSFNTLVANMDDKSLSRLQRLLPIEEISVTKAPETGLVMMTARDCFDTDFCLGEILVTIAETQIENAQGYSMVLGDNPRKAIISASLDAIFNGNDAKLKAKLIRCLRSFERRLKIQQRAESLLPSSTRVQFEAMPEG
jgi:phosphonate C-P lyase system protein PhnG